MNEKCIICCSDSELAEIFNDKQVLDLVLQIRAMHPADNLRSIKDQYPNMFSKKLVGIETCWNCLGRGQVFLRPKTQVGDEEDSESNP